MTLRALTIRQPYAGLIAIGEKTVENRSAMTSLRGEVAIHAGKATEVEELEWQLRMGVVGPFTVLGAVLAVADLVGCHTADQTSQIPCCRPYGLRIYNDRPAVHLQLANVRQLSRPVECRGQLGFWKVPADVERAIRLQLTPIEPEEASR